MDSVWESVLGRIQQSLSDQVFTTWFRPIRLVSLDEQGVLLEVPNRFFKDWLTDTHLPLIEESLQAVTGRPYVVRFQLGTREVPTQEASDVCTPAPVVEVLPRTRGATTTHNLNPKYTFDTFVAGAGNQFAHAAAFAVAASPARTYNPLFIYGGVGLGKTHLLNAVGHNIMISHPELKICYLSAEQFVNEVIYAIRYEHMIEFRKKFRDSCDVLLMDDVQFIAGKERTQEEFFHTFNTLYESHKQIVLTSERFPKEVPGFDERLRSRFEWGLIADIQAPDTETRVAILKKKAEQDGIPLPDDVALFLAENIDSNIRKLEGSLNRVGAFAHLTGSQITVTLAEQVLQKYFRDQKCTITIEYIQKLVAKHFNVKVQDLKSSRKLKMITLPRQIAMYLCREHTNNSFPRIGEEFGRKDHSTVIHAVNTIRAKLKDDISLRNSISILEKEIKR
jgi:chromosomal replication initiator protein